MSADPMTALAMTGATTIVAAMATSAWQTTRAGTARLFNRGGHDLPAIEAQLDGDADIVAEDDDTDGARQDLVGPWRRRLTALLRASRGRGRTARSGGRGSRGTGPGPAELDPAHHRPPGPGRRHDG